MVPTVEHRKHPRYVVHFKTLISPDGGRVEEGLILDLSLGGCRVMNEMHIPPETPVELDIRADQQAPIHVPRAVIRWK